MDWSGKMTGILVAGVVALAAVVLLVVWWRGGRGEGTEQARQDSARTDVHEPADPNAIDLLAVSEAIFSTGKEYDQLPKPHRAFVCVWILDGQVNNGGFDQYYFNSSGDFASDAPWALEAIGAHKTAAIARKANALFGKAGPSPDRATRWKQTDKLGDAGKAAMDKLDDEYYRFEEDVYELLKQYVRSHREAFSLNP